MDLTLISSVGHDVDPGIDLESENPDVIINIKYADYPRPVRLGFNVRPYAIECLKAANEHF